MQALRGRAKTQLALCYGFVEWLLIQFHGAVPPAVQDIGEQSREVGRQEFVGTTCEAGLGPPLVPEHALLFVGGALEPEPRCGLAGAAEVGGFAAVVITSPVPEAGFPYPQAGTELVEDDPGLFGEFAACCLMCWLVGVNTAAGQFPPVVGGVIGVASMNQQDAVARIQEQNARSQA